MNDRRFELLRTATGFDLAPTTSPRPEPGAGEVLVRVHAVSLNRRDLMIRNLSYPVSGTDRFTPLSDAAGVVVAIGAGVTRWAVGDRVTSTFFSNWAEGRLTLPALFSALGAGGTGVAADHVVLPEAGVAAMPAGWSFEQAACLPCAAVTAWSALVTLGQLQPDDWVLVLGTGGVALFALQIAVARGARVVVLSSSDAKLARAAAMGAAITVNYRTQPEWQAVVQQATGGVQHAIELGGAGTLARTLASMGVAGHVALIGALDGFGGEISGAAMAMGALRVSAVVVGSQAEHRAAAAFLAEHDCKPVIDSVFTPDRLADAYARADEGAFGKVVVNWA